MSVRFLPEVSQQFVDLVKVFYDKGYMSFPDAAQEYSESLFREIRASLPLKVHRKAHLGSTALERRCPLPLFQRTSTQSGMLSSTSITSVVKPSIWFAI